MATKKNKPMNTDEYLANLATTERKAKMLADLEKDPCKKKQEAARAKRIHKLIERVKAMAGAGIETADARKLDKEKPGTKTIH